MKGQLLQDCWGMISQGMTARIGQFGTSQPGKSVWTILPEVSWITSAWIRQERRIVKHDIRDRTAGTGQPEQDNCGRTVRRGQQGENGQDRTAGTSQPGQVGLKVSLDWSDRTE